MPHPIRATSDIFRIITGYVGRKPPKSRYHAYLHGCTQYCSPSRWLKVDAKSNLAKGDLNLGSRQTGIYCKHRSLWYDGMARSLIRHAASAWCLPLYVSTGLRLLCHRGMGRKLFCIYRGLGNTRDGSLRQLLSKTIACIKSNTLFCYHHVVHNAGFHRQLGHHIPARHVQGLPGGRTGSKPLL